MAQIIFDEYDDVTPYGITGDDAYGDEMWFDKKQMIEIGKQIYDLFSEEFEILNKSAE